MWTQRDQIQAYQFLRRRLVSALTLGDANATTSPSRRVVLATMLGVVATVLLLAAFGLFALIKPGAPSDWQQGGTVIVEKETGARFVIGVDGKAHPVLNYASARLLAGGDGSKTVQVAAKTLATVGRGLPLGIPDAPDSLPVTSSLFTGPWSVCSQVTAGAPAGATPTTTAVLGPLAAGPVLLPTGDALVVRDVAGARYLVTGGTRYELGDDAAVALGLGTAQDVPVATAFVSAVPLGRPLAVIAVEGAGGTGPRVGAGSTLVGQVLQTDNVGAGARFFVVRADGLAPVTELEAALVLGAPENRAAYGAATPEPVAVASADALGAPVSKQTLSEPPSADGTNSASAYPEVVPTVRPLTDDLTAGFVVCASSPGQGQVALVAGPTLPLPAGALPVATPPSSDPRLADAVFVAPGRGLLVATAAAPDSPQGTTYLVTDQGLKYPIGSKESLSALGYGSVRPASVTSSLLALLPTGPALSQGAAQQVSAAPTGLPTATASDTAAASTSPGAASSPGTSPGAATSPAASSAPPSPAGS